MCQCMCARMVCPTKLSWEQFKLVMASMSTGVILELDVKLSV